MLRLSRIFRWTGAAGWAAFQVVLVVVLGVQLLLLYMTVADQAIVLSSERVERRIRETLGPDFEVSVGEASWRAPLAIEFRGISIGVSRSDPILTVRRAELEWSLGAVLWREAVPDLFVVEGLSVKAPAIHSGSGSAEAIVEDYALEVARRGRGWSVERADGYILGVPALMAGRLRMDVVRSLVKDRPVSEGERISSDSRPEEGKTAPIGQVLGRLVEIREHLKAVDHPFLVLWFNAGGGDGISARWSFTGRSVAIDQDFSAAFIFATGEASVQRTETSGGELEYTLLAAAQAEDIHLNGEWQIDRLSVAAHTGRDKRAEGRYPELGIWVHKLENSQLNLDAAWAHINVDQWPTVTGRVMVLDRLGFAEANVCTDTRAGTAELELVARLNATAVVGDESIVPAQVGSKLTFSEPLSLWAKVLLDEGWELGSVQFRGAGHGVKAYGIEAATVTGAGEYNPGDQRIELHDLFMENGLYSIGGSYIGDLASNRYRFLLSGTVVPTDLNDMLDEDWWNELFSYFKFSPGNLPAADVDIGGCWNRREDRWRMFFGNVWVKSFQFRGIDYDNVDLMFYVTADTVTLFDLLLQHQDRRADAVIQWVDDEHGQEKWLGFSGVSDLPLQSLASTIGDEVEAIARDFVTEGDVTIKVAGRLWSPQLRKNSEDILLQVNFAEAVSWQGYDFDHIAGDVRLLDGNIRLNNLHFGMAGGNGTGALLLTADGGEIEKFHLVAELDGADHRELLDSVPFTRDAEVYEDKPDASQENEGTPRRSKLNLKLDLAGPVDDVDQIAGSGSLRLREGDLGRIHIFGRLSRLMDWNVVHFGSFNLANVDGEFSVESGGIHFPQLSISGPTVRLDADGVFTIGGQKLDFTLYVYPLGGGSGPIMRTLSWAFDPVTRSFKVTVSGTWDEPDYSVGFNPLNVF